MNLVRKEPRTMRRAYVNTVVNFVLCAATAAAQGQKAVGQWEPFEVTMTAARDFANTYVEALPDDGKPYAQVTFNGLSGEAKGLAFTVAAFWDEGRNWKARFAPPAAGEWAYVSASGDPGLNGVKGSFECTAWTETEKAANPTRRGFIRVARSGARAGRYFEYSDGTPFLWIGDTWWTWARRGVPFDRFRKVVDDRASKGFTVGQMLFGANNGVYMLGKTYDAPDFDNIHDAEREIAYANSKGITLWVQAWWSARNLDKEAGPEKVRRWWRYVVQRLAAYNLIWNLAGEYNMYDYGGLGLQFWKDTGAMIRREDPYRHAIGAHHTPPGWAGGEMGHSQQWSTGEVLHNEPWLDFNNSQPGHGKWRNELVPQIVSSDYARKPAKPMLVTETWYEFIIGSAPADDVRFAAWSAILSGAAGHTYGGGHQWWAFIPDPKRPSPPRLGSWPIDPEDVDTLNYPGAVSMGYMAKFLKSIRWWELEPHPELVSDYPARFCSGIPGSEYLVYARWGGKLKLDLRPSSETDKFRVAWLDLVDQSEHAGETVNGGVIRAFQAPEDYPQYRRLKDWVLYVTKTR
jgi:hypothetical protein